MKDFWLVKRDHREAQRLHPATFKHFTREGAEAEAKRLAAKHVGAAFVVFECKAVAREICAVDTKTEETVATA